MFSCQLAHRISPPTVRDFTTGGRCRLSNTISILTVNFASGEMDYALNTSLDAGVKEINRAENVDPKGVNGASVVVRHAGDRRAVNDRRNAFDCAPHGLQIKDIALNNLYVARLSKFWNETQGISRKRI